MTPKQNSPIPSATRPFRRREGFSLIEVILAVLILGLGIAGSLVTLQMAFGMTETARDQTLASQFLQAEIETLRLKNWADFSQLPVEEEFMIHSEFGAEVDNRFKCTRRIENVRTGTDLKRVIVKANWSTQNGVARELAYETRISKNGINDYYYRALPPE